MKTIVETPIELVFRRPPSWISAMVALGVLLGLAAQVLRFGINSGVEGAALILILAATLAVGWFLLRATELRFDRRRDAIEITRSRFAYLPLYTERHPLTAFRGARVEISPGAQRDEVRLVLVFERTYPASSATRASASHERALLDLDPTEREAHHAAYAINQWAGFER